MVVLLPESSHNRGHALTRHDARGCLVPQSRGSHAGENSKIWSLIAASPPRGVFDDLYILTSKSSLLLRTIQIITAYYDTAIRALSMVNGNSISLGWR